MRTSMMQMDYGVLHSLLFFKSAHFFENPLSFVCVVLSQPNFQTFLRRFSTILFWFCVFFSTSIPLYYENNSHRIHW